jgi:hypothetical protein
MNTNQPAERQNCQITPFTYENRAVRAVVIEKEPWFVAKDICDVLGIVEARSALRDFPDSEKGVHTTHTLGGKQEMLTVNEPGLYRLVFQSRKPEAERFKTWVFNDVLPKIRQTGSYGNEGDACAGRIYSLFSGCQDMTIQRMNKIIYYFALDPPLSNVDISKLLGVSGGIVTHWRRRLPAETARKALKALAINAQGIASSKAALPLELPAREAQDERA